LSQKEDLSVLGESSPSAWRRVTLDLEAGTQRKVHPRHGKKFLSVPEESNDPALPLA
jgi:hypothetical protein